MLTSNVTDKLWFNYPQSILLPFTQQVTTLWQDESIITIIMT